MKRKVVLLVILSMIFTCIASFESAGAAATFQKVDYTDAKVTVDMLNLRQGPSASSHIVCVLKKGQSVKIFGKIGDWTAVYEPSKGFVGVVDSKCLSTSSKAAAPSTPAPKPQKKAAQKSIQKTIPKAAPKSNLPKSPAQFPPVSMNISTEEQQVLDLINAERQKAGVGPLTFDSNLLKASRDKATDMSNNNYFSHQSPTYGSPFDMMRQYGITFRTAGENIAGNQSAERAVSAWMNSEGHRKNILNPEFNCTGIGIAPSQTYGKVYVQQFIGK
ncbi:MAG TPA: CAP domain-containing protein [Clostridia bacterium]